MSYQRKLLSCFLDTINGTDFDAEAAKRAAPVIDMILGAVREDRIFRANETASIA